MKAAKPFAVLGSITLCALVGLALTLAPGSAIAQSATCTKADTPDPVAPGGTITYTITFSSEEVVNDPRLTDAVPAQTTFGNWTAPAGWFNTTPTVGGTGAVTAVHPGPFVGSATFTFVVNASPLAVGTIENTMTVAGATTLCTATATTAVEAPPPPCERFKEHKKFPDKSKCKDK